MKRGLQGRYETVSTVGETVKAFIPNPLPPFPALEITGELQKKERRLTERPTKEGDTQIARRKADTQMTLEDWQADTRQIGRAHV